MSRSKKNRKNKKNKVHTPKKVSAAVMQPASVATKPERTIHTISLLLSQTCKHFGIAICGAIRMALLDQVADSRDFLDEARALMTQIIIDLDHEAAKVTASLNETVDKVGESALALKSIVERRVEMARDIHELFAAQLRIDQVRKSNPDLFNKTEAANLNSRLNKVLADLPTTITKRPHIRAGGWVHRRDIATQASNYCRSRQGRVRGSPAQGD